MNIEQIYSKGDVRPGESQRRLQTDYTIHSALSICGKKKRKRWRGEERGRCYQERKVGLLGIIRWEFKGAPNLRYNQASGPRSVLTLSQRFPAVGGEIQQEWCPCVKLLPGRVELSEN